MTVKECLAKWSKNCAVLLFLAFSFSLLSSSNATSASFLYWADQTGNVIKRSGLDGSNVETIHSSLNNPTSIEVDISAGKIYWAESAAGTIKRSNLDGSGVQTILSSLDSPVSITLDVSNGKVYWAETLGSNLIQRANLDGTTVETIFTPADANGPVGLDIDAANSKLYWVDNEVGFDTHVVRRSGLDGSSVETVVSNILNTPSTNGIHIDATNQKMYYVIFNFFGPDFVRRSNLDGSSDELVLQNPDVTVPRGIDIDESAGKLYIANGANILRSNLDGSSVETITSDPSVAFDVALALSSINTAAGTNITSTFDSTNSYLGDNTTLLADSGDIAITYDQVNTEGNTNVAFGEVNVNQTALTAFLDANWNFFPISNGGEGIVYEFSKADGLDFNAGVTITVKVNNSVTFHGFGVNDLVGAYLKSDGSFEIIQGTYTPGNQTFSFNVPTGSFSGFGVAVNPEPSTFVLIGTGLFGLWRKRRNFFK